MKEPKFGTLEYQRKIIREEYVLPEIIKQEKDNNEQGTRKIKKR